MAQVVANERELSLLWFDVSDFTDTLNGLSVVDVATDSVNRIGRVDDNPTFTKTIHHFTDGLRIGVLFIDTD